jgi:hypothetical protein
MPDKTAIDQKFRFPDGVSGNVRVSQKCSEKTFLIPFSRTSKANPGRVLQFPIPLAKAITAKREQSP